MNKFLIASALIATLGGSFSSALADTMAAAYASPAAQGKANSANKLPCAVADLKRNVQGLQREVQVLQAQNQTIRDENAQNLDAIPAGG